MIEVPCMPWLTTDPIELDEADEEAECLFMRADNCGGEWSLDDAWRAFHLIAFCAWAKFGEVVTFDGETVVMDRDLYTRHFVYAMGDDFLERTYGREAACEIVERYQLGIGVRNLIPKGRMRVPYYVHLTPGGMIA